MSAGEGPAWPGTLVETAWLAANLRDPDLRIVDIRGAVRMSPSGDGEPRAEYVSARDEYDQGHVPGAVFVDWTADIVDHEDRIAVQLAAPDRFAAVMGDLGIGDESCVVIYDGSGGAFATRLWWALTHYGHERVAVLNGGWDAWLAESRPASAAGTRHHPTTFTPKAGRLGRATGDEVLEHVRSGDAVIVDALRLAQYTGEQPRGGMVSGHIPGALNLPYTDLFTSRGTWKQDDELATVLEAAGVVEDERPVVAYCGGGVAATAVLFALDRIGRLGDLYDGSWNEWGNDPRFPVRRGAAP